MIFVAKKIISCTNQDPIFPRYQIEISTSIGCSKDKVIDSNFRETIRCIPEVMPDQALPKVLCQHTIRPGTASKKFFGLKVFGVDGPQVQVIIR